MMENLNLKSLENTVIQLIKTAPVQLVSFNYLTRHLNLGSDQKRIVRTLLSTMVKARVLLKLKGNRYKLPSPSQQASVAGKISVHRDGYGFVIPEKRPPYLQGDLFIPPRYMGDAMHGDSVLASLARGSRGNRAEGRVIKVLRRQNTTLIGQFHVGSPYHLVTPYDFKIQQEVLIREGDQQQAPNDSIVNVEITQFPSRRTGSLRGRVVEVLGSPGDVGLDFKIIVRKHHIPVEFPQAILDEVLHSNQHVSIIESKGRSDFRHLPIVTIDGETAKDFDDAVHVKRLKNGNFQLGVHIADVDHYVNKNSALDKEAFRRGTSVYFPDRSVPMLPEELSNGICSLKPKEDRLTLSLLIEVDGRGQVRDYSFHESLIRSHERMTYTSVAKILLDRDLEECSRYAPFVNEFEQMQELAFLLYDKRHERGSIDFDLPEAELTLDESGTLTNILRSERNIAHRIIEEFMLLANEITAQYLDDQKIPSLYRIHERPDPLKVLEFNETAMDFGYQLGQISGNRTELPSRMLNRSRQRAHGPRQKGKDLNNLRSLNVKVTPNDYQKLVDQILDKPEERILSYLMLRSMKQARYTPHNRGHFGLASDCYTHFTSPIRRYPDLTVHRILKQKLQSENNQDPNPEDSGATSFYLYDLETLESIALQSSETERRAAAAERELIDLKKLDFMTRKLGEEFEGIIIHLTREGMLVELNELFVEGFVGIETLREDDYQLRSRPLSLVGQRSRRIFQLGYSVKVCVDRVDRFRRRVDLSII